MTTKISSDNIQSATLTQLGSAVPKISAVSYSGNDTSTDPAGGQTVTITGAGFNAGAVVYVNGSAVGVVTVVSSTEITFTAPANSAGTYTLYVVNTDGGTAIYVPGVSYSGVPTWSNAAGSLGTQYEATSISKTLVATGDAPITYSLYSGTLPTGATLASNGVLSGTAPASSGSTTYSFTIRATDAQNQDTDRAFSLTIDTDVVTWSSPSDGTAYSVAQTQAISNVALTATSAAGFGVTYSANTLPTGLSVSGNVITGTPTTIETVYTLLTATASNSSRTATRTISWSVVLSSDTYLSYTALLLSGNSSVTASSFINDASSNNAFLSISGDTRALNFNPYQPGYYSVYLDGVGDYVDASTATTIGTGDFTAECWAWIPSTQVDAYTCFITSAVSSGGSIGIVMRKTMWWIGTGSSTPASINPSSYYVYNQWMHVAMTRSGSTVRAFVNGVLAGSMSSTDNIASTQFRFGCNYTDTTAYGLLTGYISNARIVAGTALYTAAFTPSTSPFTAVSGTQLLTLNSNRFVDTSGNNRTVTNAGDASIKSANPFVLNSSYASYGSGYFDGTGDYLTIPYSSSYNIASSTQMTFECWAYPTTTGAFVMANRNWNFGGTGPTWGFFLTATNLYPQWSIAGTGSATYVMITSTIAAKINQWNHIAFSRDASNVVRVFVNGVLGGSRTDSQAMTSASGDIFIGNPSGGTATYANGYMSDMRLVIGSCVYSSNSFTPPTAPLTSVENTQLLTLQTDGPYNNNQFQDNSNFNNLVVRTGNPTQGTFGPYGTNWSIYCNNNGCVTVPASANYNIGTSDFTMEFWMFPTISGVNNIMCSHQIGGMFQILVTASNTITFNFNSSGGSSTGYTGTTTASTVTINAWNHVVASRVSGTVYFYINGTRDANSWAASGINIGSYGGNKPFYLGAAGDLSAFFSGYLSNYRYVLGTGIYSGATITVPTTPLTWVNNTAILALQNNRFIDNSTYNAALTTNGTAPTVQKFNPFSTVTIPTYYSNYFDGTSDYLDIAGNTAFDLSTADFTIEGWFYPIAANGMIVNYGVVPGSSQGSYNYQVYAGSTNLVVRYSTGGFTSVNSSNAYNLNAWNYFCISRTTTSISIYLNGTTTTGSIAATINNNASSTLRIGMDIDTNYSMNGYISNLRILKGTATPSPSTPTAPLTAIANTSLLTCQSNTFIDNSTNKFAITVNGNAKPLAVSPFTPTASSATGYSATTFSGSMFFDGTGDYLSVSSLPALGTGDFTIDGWVYASGAVTNRGVFQLSTAAVTTTLGLSLAYYTNGNGWQITYGSGSSLTITSLGIPISGVWYHFAMTRQSGTLRTFINGVLGDSRADTTNYTGTVLSVGGYYSTSQLLIGYMSDMRVIPGTALYTSAFYPGASPSVAVGTNPGTTAVYNSTAMINGTTGAVVDATRTVDLETVGNVTTTTSISPYSGGGVSYYFDGTGDYLTVNGTNTALTLGTGNFTIDFWVYLNATTGYLIDFRPSGTNGVYPTLYVTAGSLRYYVSTADRITSGSTLSTGQWYYVALVRSSGSTKLYLNGTQTGSTYADTNNYIIGAGRPVIGVANDLTTSALNGYISDLRITKGYARYTTTFTPPTVPGLII